MCESVRGWIYSAPLCLRAERFIFWSLYWESSVRTPSLSLNWFMFPSTAPCRLKLDLMQWSAPWRLVGGSSHWCSAPRTWKPHGHATYPASICTWQAREVPWIRDDCLCFAKHDMQVDGMMRCNTILGALIAMMDSM